MSDPGADINGAEGQNRTVDTSLFRAVLCQLSYLGTGGTITTLFPKCQDDDGSRFFTEDDHILTFHSGLSAPRTS